MYTHTSDILQIHHYTCKAEVFLPGVACGVVEFEHVQHSLRVFLLLQFGDVGGLQEPSPLFRHALRDEEQQRKQDEMKIERKKFTSKSNQSTMTGDECHEKWGKQFNRRGEQSR